MDALKDVLRSLGFTDVVTYIQSGNVVFKKDKSPVHKMEDIIRRGIHEHFGFDIPVRVIEAENLKRIMEAHPYRKRTSENKLLHITFLTTVPTPEHLEKLRNFVSPPDEFTIVQDAVYLYCPGGYGNTKLSNAFFESKLKVGATTRNINTILELLSLAGLRTNE